MVRRGSTVRVRQRASHDLQQLPGAPAPAPRGQPRHHAGSGRAGSSKPLDKHGLEGLTMRKLGASLHVTAPTLYWHVRDREEVLDLAYDAVVGELPTPDRADEDDWRPAARRSLVALRAMVIRHSWWAQLRPTRAAVGPEAMRVTGGLVELLVGAGLNRTALEAALTLMTDFAVGATAIPCSFGAGSTLPRPTSRQCERTLSRRRPHGPRGRHTSQPVWSGATPTRFAKRHSQRPSKRS
jgi:AcrR family transcriptional regulator